MEAYRKTNRAQLAEEGGSMPYPLDLPARHAAVDN